MGESSKGGLTVSLITCTYNGESIIEECIKGIISQNYPKEKIEWIIADGGSSDQTVRIIKKYERKYPHLIKFYKNHTKFSDGRGKGYDLFSRKAKKETICFLDQDNILVQKDWLKKMLEILEKRKNISAVQSRMIVPKQGTYLDKYLNAIGIEDPFAINYSLNAQIVLNPKKFHFDKEGQFWEYKINPKKFYYAGGNGFLIRKLDFFSSGGWNQDIDLFYRMGLNGYTVAIPKEIKLHHMTSTNLKHFLIKRNFYVQHYLTKNYEKRDFYWFDLRKNGYKQNLRFIKTIIFNLILFPAIFQSILMLVKKKKSYWLLHIIVPFMITISYILNSILIKFGLKIDQF